MRGVRGVGSIALAAVVAGALLACAGEPTTGVPCNFGFWALYDDEMPDLDMTIGDTMEIPLKDYFAFPTGCVDLAKEWDIDIFEVTSADPAVAVSIANDLTTLEIAAIELVDSVRVEARAVGHENGHEFLVRVRPR